MYGSKNSAQEQGCNIPEMQWIGPKAEDVVWSQSGHDVLMALSKRDRACAISMLSSQEWQDEAGDALPGLHEAVSELRQMLMLNRKAEIQSLGETQGGLEDWLTERLTRKLGA
jgi:DNA topoisomerase VI subunit A